MSESAHWLEWLFGTNPPGLIWIGGHADGFKGRTFASPGEAAEYGQWLDGQGRGDGLAGVYFRLTLMREGEGKGRGKAEDSSHLLAFGADLDLAGPGHKPAKLPRPDSEQQLLEIMADAGAPEPSALVHSGGGRYAFWKMAEPIDLSDPDIFTAAQQRSTALHASIIEAGKRRGFKIDNTRDLARVYRLPGTHNRKSGEPFVAHVITSDGPRHAFRAFSAIPGDSGDRPGIEESAGHSVGDSGDSPSVGGGFAATALFGGGSEAAEKVADAGRLRTFTVGQAMGWVQPFLERLRGAAVGEINVALNDAALAMAHFGPEFWSREAAEGQLYGALGATEYDGATWQAGDTIRSAYDAMAARSGVEQGLLGGEYWRAVMVLDASGQMDASAALAAVTGDEVDALLAEMLSPEDLIGRPPPRHLVRGLLTFDSEAWLIGAPGSKKSFVALDLACHVANGMAWQGRKTQQAKVVIIAAEGGGGIGKRLDAWQRTYGAIAPGQVRVLARPVQAQDVAAWAVLVKACERLGAGFVVIDTQARVTVGLEENSARDMGIYTNAARMIRAATGACVMTVHHTGRRGGDARGSSAIDGAQDTELKIEPVRRAFARLRVEKQKDIEPAPDVKLKFERVALGVDDEGDVVDSLVLVRHDAWASGEMDDESFDALDAEAAKEVTPFMVRSEPEEWTKRVTPSRAINQRWILQALADAGDYGLTSSQLRSAVEGKIGRKFTRKDEWDVDTFKIVSKSDSPAVLAGVVVKVDGAARWTVDPMAVEALRK